jgi:hypothetical protein
MLKTIYIINTYFDWVCAVFSLLCRSTGQEASLTLPIIPQSFSLIVVVYNGNCTQWNAILVWDETRDHKIAWAWMKRDTPVARGSTTPVLLLLSLANSEFWPKLQHPILWLYYIIIWNLKVFCTAEAFLFAKDTPPDTPEKL